MMKQIEPMYGLSTKKIHHGVISSEYFRIDVDKYLEDRRLHFHAQIAQKINIENFTLWVQKFNLKNEWHKFHSRV